MNSNQANPKMPLTEEDREALEALFDKIDAEEIGKIEKITAFFSAAPLDPWEEQGWILNSSLSNYRD